MQRFALRWVAVVALALGLVVAPLAAQFPTQAASSLTMLGNWGGQELEAFNKVLKAFEKETGIRVDFTGTRDLSTVLTTRVAAGNPPDVAALPNPGQMQELAAGGHLVDLSKVLDMEEIKKEYSPAWLDLGSYNGKLYSIFISADLKSLVWYNPQAFAAKGFTIPKTWADMMALTEKIAAGGEKPWSIGLESGAASGWPGTDWIEDIMLRIAGPQVYDKWVRHQIAWTDPIVRQAFEMFGQIARNPKYVYGGVTGVLSTNFGDAVNPLFTKPVGAYMHRQATFIQSFIRQNNPGLVAGKDYDFFGLPMVKPEIGQPALGAADMIGLMRDTPAGRKLVQFLASPQAQALWVSSLGKLAANRMVDPQVYPDPLTRKAAQILAAVPIFRFDGSDLMPAAIGSGAFWEGILKYVGGQNVDQVLKTIEAAAQDVYQ